jgi:predicted ATPase
VEAAEAICGDASIDVLDGLASLVDRSMLQRGETDGKTRFGMLETIRAFAVERLTASGEADALRRRHAAYFLAFAEAAQKKFHGADDGEELNRLEVEHANLRAALRFFADEADLESAVRLLGGLD